MKLWQTTVLAKLRPRRITVLRSLIAFLLVLNLTSCGDKAVSQVPNTSSGVQEKVQLSKQISEVSPPAAIQELRQALEVYQPQVTIVTPKSDEVLQDNTVNVSFLVKDLPIFKESQLDIGPHLHVILDNEPYTAIYDLNQPLVLPELSPGTHTLRVFASHPWNESFKNEGAYAETTFHIFTKTDDNHPNPAKPLLTYNSPQGRYGSEPILLDFYLTQAPLHIVAQDNPKDEIADWRIRCTINGESFVLDRWQAVYLKGFKPGKNWVKLEFLDEQGNPVKNVFNSTVRLITYEPKGRDTLSKIVRGEISIDKIRGIVDPNYTAKTPNIEPTPTSTPSFEKLPETQPLEEKLPTVEPTPTVSPTLPEIIKSPLPETTIETQPEVTPEAESKTLPDKVAPQAEKKRLRGFFQRRREPSVTPQPTPTVSPTLPEILESPLPETTIETQPEVTPEAESKTLPDKVAPQAEKKRLRGFFQRRREPSVTPQPTPTVSPTLPEILESPLPETTIEPQPEVTPEAESKILPDKVAPQAEKKRLREYFQRRWAPSVTPEATPTVSPTLPEILESPLPETTIEPQPEVTPEAESKILPDKVAPQPGTLD
ncbi:MAG: hypothetical protein PUP93_09215 [Rhizonema sp. NSF051]|nr:hypothetical protein [Rhizonema sp. NSF051]